MSGKLYIVPTPVGNLGDMAPRAVEVLRSASLVLAEDTRTSAVLMRHFGIDTPMASHHKFNEHKNLDPILDRIEAGRISLSCLTPVRPASPTRASCCRASAVGVA